MTKIHNHHERYVAASPETVAELISDFDTVWPAERRPVIVEHAPGFYHIGTMVWQELTRPGAARAFRVITPASLRVDHWFEVAPRDGGTLLSHTVAGDPTEEGERFWREEIESRHDASVELIFDTVEAAVAL